MIVKVYPDNPADRHLNLIVDILRKGGVIIYPTDTVYAFGCDMNNQSAIDKMLQVSGKGKSKSELSLICSGLSNISHYTVPFEKKIYKSMNKALPGPFTFILNANNRVPKIFEKNKKTIGIRVPNNKIPTEVVERLGNPLVTTSIKIEDSATEYLTDPSLIYERFGKQVDLVIDGGIGDNEASTVLDCTGSEIEIIREGKGEVGLVA
jgi:tRNA threonylcarbamoyl adenosine modification protein (Sua5/YciO/YrdC/YwlC family)